MDHRKARRSARLPLHRFEEFTILTTSEVESLRSIGERPVEVERGKIIRNEGVIPLDVFLLVEGWASASIDFPDGKRQIVKIHLPGDLLGVASMCMAVAPEALSALTSVVISRVPVKRFGSLLADHPRLAALLFLSAQRERVALMDALAQVGRRSAIERLASLLLDIAGRLSVAGKVRPYETAFHMPLTQEQIGDALGLSIVHVNRSLQIMHRSGLITRTNQHIAINDTGELERLAGCSMREVTTHLDWLPAAR